MQRAAWSSLMAVHGNRSKRGYGSIYTPVSTVNMCYASVYGDCMLVWCYKWFICAQLWICCRMVEQHWRLRYDLMFLDFARDVHAVLRWSLWRTTFDVKVQFTLCMLCISSELRMFVDYIVFLVDLHVRCQQQTNKSTLFAAKLRFAFFRSCMSFFTTCLWRRWMFFWEFDEELWMWKWKWLVNSTKLNSLGRMMSVLHRCLFSRRNSRKKTT